MSSTECCKDNACGHVNVLCADLRRPPGRVVHPACEGPGFSGLIILCVMSFVWILN